MRKILGSLLVGTGSVYWWFSKEFVKAAFFDRMLRMLESNPTPFTDLAIQYGPPLIFVAIGIYLLASERPQAAAAPDLVTIPSPELDELLKTGLREGFRKYNVLVEEGIRPSIKSKFLRMRSLYKFFAKPPFTFYWAKRRIEFIDAWKWFFRAHDKVVLPDISTEHGKRDAQITAGLLYMVNQAADAIYHLARRPDDLKMEIEASMHRHFSLANGGQSPGIVQSATGRVLPAVRYNKAQIGKMLEAIDALYPPLLGMEQVLLTGTWIAGSTEAIIRDRGARHFLAEMDQLRQKLLDPLTRFEAAVREFSLYTEVCLIVDDNELRKNAFFASYNALATIVREIQDQQLSPAALTIFLEGKRKDFVERTAEYFAWAQLKKKALSESREQYLHWQTTD